MTKNEKITELLTKLQNVFKVERTIDNTFSPVAKITATLNIENLSDLCMLIGDDSYIHHLGLSLHNALDATSRGN
jgi:N-glycosylase/DNA lyase